MAAQLIQEKEEQPIDLLFANDWLTAPIFLEYPKPAAKVMMLHNTYDEERSLAEARYMGLKIPHYFRECYSPLTIGLRESDVVIADSNYVRSITETADRHAPMWVKALKRKASEGRGFFASSPSGRCIAPHHQPQLNQDGYHLLKDFQLESVSAFKRENQQTLQQQLGLRVDPDARLLLWLNRFDYPQKGLWMVLETMPDLLAKYPALQLVMAINPCSHPNGQHLADEAIYKLKQRFPDRVVLLPRERQTNKAGLIAGCTYVMLPSLYEPFGITQLEAMHLGTIPIVHAVDGLLSTVADPDMPTPIRAVDKAYYADAQRPDPSYGQTGFLMPRVAVRAYQRATQHLLAHPGKLSRQDRIVLKEANQAFQHTIERALAQPADQLPIIGLQAMRYVDAEHSWDNILNHYHEAFEAAYAIAFQNKD